MRKSTTWGWVVLMGSFVGGNAFGTLVTPYGSDGKGTGLQTKLNPLVTPASGDTWNPGVSNGQTPKDFINGTVQNGQSALDVIWNLAGANASATIVLEIAGNASKNTFGFYDPANPSGTQAQLFNGAASTGSKVFIKFSGNQLQSSANNSTWVNVANGGFSSTTFGMYLKGPGGTFYSNPALNPGGGDNLVAYQGFGNTATGRKLKIGSGISATQNAWDSKSYVLAWEDLPLAKSDKDYQDMVILVSSITPVPEPSTFVAAALLMIPLVAQARRVRPSNVTQG